MPIDIDPIGFMTTRSSPTPDLVENAFRPLAERRLTKSDEDDRPACSGQRGSVFKAEHLRATAFMAATRLFRPLLGCNDKIPACCP